MNQSIKTTDKTAVALFRSACDLKLVNPASHRTIRRRDRSPDFLQSNPRFPTVETMSKYTNIVALVARTQDALETGCDDCRSCDTIAEAKKFARYSLTEAYRISGEFSELMNCARVMATEDGREVCIEEYWRKGWTPAPVADDCEEPEDPRAGLAGNIGEHEDHFDANGAPINVTPPLIAGLIK